jgi:hypothetical protein
LPIAFYNVGAKFEVVIENDACQKLVRRRLMRHGFFSRLMSEGIQELFFLAVSVDAMCNDVAEERA